jgi:hypothetical protein
MGYLREDWSKAYLKSCIRTIEDVIMLMDT